MAGAKKIKSENGVFLGLSIGHIITIVLALIGGLSAFFILRGNVEVVEAGVVGIQADVKEVRAFQVKEVDIIHPSFVTNKEMREKLKDVIDPVKCNVERIEAGQMKLDDKMDELLLEVRKIPK